MSDYQIYIKQLRRTDAESLEYMQYALYVGDAKTIPEACRLNEKRIQEKQKRARQLALEEEERERIRDKERMIELERNRLQFEKDRKIQLERERIQLERERIQAEKSGGISVGKVIAGGAIIAGTALVLGPVAAGVAAKIIKHL